MPEPPHYFGGELMVNERKTENIFRGFLRDNGYYDSEDIVVEEQKSDNAKIDKLLKNASKKGGGRGYPEFIISSKTHSNLIIVVECKANISNHESENRDMYGDFAVDGVLLYSSFLSKEYDVLAIAISGEQKSKIKISQFIQLKETTESHQYFGEQIIDFNQYYEGLMHSNFKFNQDYGKLITYTKKLNKLLHSKKIKESQRALLISGILIALKNDAFKSSYKKHKTINSLIENLYATFCSEIAQSGVKEDVIKKIKTSFSFLKTSTSLTDKKDGKSFVEGLIADIDEEINGFMKNHKYVDTVSQFYVEFLRYANNDKGLGIVLTPSHITELFVELAEVNKESVVFDNCCGTGGFLISAMKKMTDDAKGNITKERKIKNSQLIGIEYQDDIYALLVSNMILHEDGKTNMLLDDCFDRSEEIKMEFKPTVGLLNPPYKSETDDIEELEFVISNLESLPQGGKCVTIIPLSCVIDTTKTIALNLKERLLSKHTVEAVMSLPEDLFHNSDVNVVTCAIVITANVPHPKNKKTWFAYWRDDGFVKVKNKGRIDKNNVWNNIMERWVSSFINREIIDGFSLSRKITKDDEWCAEAYMVTDYSKLDKDEFKDYYKKYLTYKILNNMEEENEESD